MPVTAETSITIDRPVEEVFATIADVANHGKWSRGVEKVAQISESPARLGTTWTQITPFLGQKLECQGKVVRYEANRVFGAQMDKPFPAQMTFTLEPSGSGTRVKLSGEFEFGGLFSLAAPILGGKVKSEWDRDLGNLKARLEGQPAQV